MLTGALQRYNWILRILIPVFLVATALVTALVISVKTELATLIFEVFLLLIVSVLTRANLSNLAIAFIITDHLCQFFKRFIFLWGPQSHPLYYAIQLLPDVFLALGILLVFQKLTRTTTTLSSKMLMAYAGFSVLTSLLNARATSLTAGLGGFYQDFMLLSALFLGMMLPVTLFSRLGRVLAALILISVPYGLYQFITGPTAIDRAWAEAMHDSSIEAGRVYQAFTVTGSEFRAYSYYADHTTWGLFLALASIVVIMSVTLGMLKRRWLYLVIPTAMVGLVICETRTAWLAFLGTLVVYRLITTRLLRRPMLLVLGVISSFAVVVTLGDYVAHHVNVGAFSSSLLNRYATVGTVEARTSAWKLFARNLPSHWLLGTGFGYANANKNISLADEVFSHNMYVELLVTTGLPGLLLFLSFFYFWIREAFWVAKIGTRDVSRAALWSISLVVAMLLTGSVQGLNFMNLYLCLIMGITSGMWRQAVAAPSVLTQVTLGRAPRRLGEPVPVS